MASESPDPKRPFYDKEGRVRDHRIAQAMAKKEDIASRTRALHMRLVGEDESGRKDPQEAAESRGEEFYRENGIEIPPESVPENVMKVFREIAAVDAGPTDDPYVEFRRIDTEEGKPAYVMLFHFLRMNDNWMCMHVRCTADGIASEVEPVVFAR